MQFTPAFQRAAHPLPLAAAGLVILNDLVLRPLWPTAWWTGKLSSLAAAFALPLLLAAFLSVCLPRREKLAAGLAFGGVLLGLLLLKVSPLSNHWLTARLPLRAVPDPSDLLALLTWLAALVFYFSPVLPNPRLPIARLLLLPLAAIFLLADAAMPDYGAACLTVREDNTLLTHANYQVYLSADGGRTWQGTDLSAQMECYAPGLDGQVELTAPNGVQYRVQTGGTVERSPDGQTWETVYTGALLPEPEQVYTRRTHSGNLSYRPGPLDAKLAPGGNDLVLAMGMEGVLIVPSSGEPYWVTVGPYQHNLLKTSGFEGYLSLLSGELWLAGAAALAWLATAALRLRRSTWQMVLVVLGWLLILVAGAARHPDINSGYLAAFAGVGLVAAFGWALILVLVAFFRQRGRPLHPLTRRVLFIPLFMAVFMLPFIAWALGLLPLYWIAQAAAAALTVAMVGLVN
jgi:hypothetical protein